MAEDKYYFIAELEEPHKTRCREIIKSHPEVADLIGRNPWTGAILFFTVALQLVIAAYLGTMGMEYWWVALLASWFIGAFANHALFVIIHEATHNLIFKKRLWNKIAGVVADFPNVAPGALAFRTYHIKHHAYMGDHEWDADLPNIWEAELVKNSWWRKAIWLFFFPVMQISRTVTTTKVNTIDTWVIINLVACIAIDVAVVYFFGWNGFIYLLGSLFFSLGLHPLGARWIQEHYTLTPDQETYSYYGPLNTVALNVGYHNEHHDFPAIPWNNLPKLKAAAPEYYDTLMYHKSWTKLLLSFLFNKEYSLYSRIIREKSVMAERQVAA